MENGEKITAINDLEIKMWMKKDTYILMFTILRMTKKLSFELLQDERYGFDRFNSIYDYPLKTSIYLFHSSWRKLYFI